MEHRHPGEDVASPLLALLEIFGICRREYLQYFCICKDRGSEKREEENNRLTKKKPSGIEGQMEWLPRKEPGELLDCVLVQR